MKKYVAAAVLTIFGFMAAGPFIAAYQIRNGVEQRDAVLLSEHIDYPTLRVNLKEQFNAALAKEAQPRATNTPFAALAMALASKLADGMVDLIVTPESLAELMAGERPRLKDKNNAERRRKLYENSRFTYDNLSQFSIWIKNERSQEVRFVLTRYGLTWKLTNIVIPIDD
jgi:hypothetical protein